MRKDNLQKNYHLRMRLVTICSLFVVLFAFYTIPKFEPNNNILEEKEFIEIINVELVKPPSQETNYKSNRPPIPIEADEESDIDSVNFENTDIEGFGDWGMPPPPSSTNNRPVFVDYDQAPIPKKPLMSLVKYPDICKQAGIEGRVTIKVWIDNKGRIDQQSIEVIESIPCMDNACIQAIKKSKWKPARMGRKKVGVPLNVPFVFKLESSG